MKKGDKEIGINQEVAIAMEISSRTVSLHLILQREVEGILEEIEMGGLVGDKDKMELAAMNKAVMEFFMEEMKITLDEVSGKIWDIFPAKVMPFRTLYVELEDMKDADWIYTQYV